MGLEDGMSIVNLLTDSDFDKETQLRCNVGLTFKRDGLTFTSPVGTYAVVAISIAEAELNARSLASHVAQGGEIVEIIIRKQ